MISGRPGNRPVGGDARVTQCLFLLDGQCSLIRDKGMDKVLILLI